MLEPLPAELLTDDEQTTTFGSVEKVKPKSKERLPCECPCLCGANRDPSREKCWGCSRGLHHKCSRACREYPAIRTAEGVNLSAIPMRFACNGGRTR